ncbi:Outer membrane protein beta-barrel domain-containing protein [Maridesulfovibrio ferrireducens]|uniref:Outer membrane protein beta-barrel domain-containing protein n=1 Tax=Maridesulfovibrio ferrireducens TaxID=246191 RepID=A0A1G9IAJ1_9BACT|nr:outer membrane beta-barrel protein [Maridesulfovibrio ferrireducens]SDL22237.1 Outer membrane protein beta-barrel domain-containing protein [Maridesulfovibrio ferrireducens]
MRILTLFILLLIFPLSAQAWQGKIIAVDSSTSLIVLKDGQDPVKIKISGIIPSPEVDKAKGKLECSSIALMKEAEINETGKNDENTILADVIINGQSLAQELIKIGVVQQIGNVSTTPQPESANADKSESVAAPADNISENPTSNKIISELSTNDDQISSDHQYVAPAPKQSYKSVPTQAPVIRYVQVQQQPQQLGFWPARPVQIIQPQAAAPSVTAPIATTTKTPSDFRQPGDIAQEEYDLAIRVKKGRPLKKNQGFFLSKKKSETFIGAAVGTQYSTKSKTDVPYASFGPSGGLTIRHFYPSGLGLGGDMMISGTSGRSGSLAASSNATNGTSYDYKSKSFNTYTFTASLLYRFYTDSKFTPYIAAQGGYSFFGYPNTDFNISDGAPVAGGGLGFLYEFDSGFTIGSDVRYLKTFGRKAHDPDGFLNTTINFGYTFD